MGVLLGLIRRLISLDIWRTSAFELPAMLHFPRHGSIGQFEV
jgi:hypothetical protein